VKNLLPPIIFLSIRHIFMLFIPENWREDIYLIPLHPELFNHKKVKVMKPRTIIGIIFIVASLLKLATIWGFIHWSWFTQVTEQPWATYFCIFVVLYMGVSMIIDSYRRDPDQWLQRPLPIGEDGKRICCSVHYGGDEYVYHGEIFHGARLDAFCGGIRMDLREAVITEDEEIDIHTFCGGIELIVPSTVNVNVKSQSFIGGVGNHTARTTDPKAPTIHIVASNFIGGVDIKN
jgi:hypothetical protein